MFIFKVKITTINSWRILDELNKRINKKNKNKKSFYYFSTNQWK